jgi:hypothetical protein
VKNDHGVISVSGVATRRAERDRPRCSVANACVVI